MARRGLKGEQVIEQFDGPRTGTYWAKNKKPSINLLQDSPFAADRQFEDQRYQILKNRNPQADVPTKADKSRSQIIIAKKGASRTISIKAKVVNKIVREESGIHTFTLVPPPKSMKEGTRSLKEIEAIDPETHPALRPYANEVNTKPIMTSFGHRPSSASRTFHPATMKVRLRHGEIAKADVKVVKTGFGLPVAILSKLLHAPKLPLIDGAGSSEAQTFDRSDLFSLPKTSEMSPMDVRMEKGGVGAGMMTGGSSLTRPSWVSQQTSMKDSGTVLAPVRTIKRQVQRGKAATISVMNSQDRDRPNWNDKFHNLERSRADAYNLKKSGIDEKIEMPLVERMHRFSSKTFAEAQITPFCSEKQVTDTLQRTGKLEPLRLRSLREGAKAYKDPFDERLHEIQKQNAVLTRQKEQRWKEILYQQALKDIPKVGYNPNTALKLMQSGEGGKLFSVAAEKGSSDPYVHAAADQKHPVEAGLDAAMKAAKAGDREALFNYFMNQEKFSQGDDKAKLIAQRVAEAEARLAAMEKEMADEHGFQGTMTVEEEGEDDVGAYDYAGHYGEDDEGYIDIDRGESELQSQSDAQGDGGSHIGEEEEEDPYKDGAISLADHLHASEGGGVTDGFDYHTGTAEGGNSAGGGGGVHDSGYPNYDDSYHYGVDDSVTYEYSVDGADGGLAHHDSGEGDTYVHEGERRQVIEGVKQGVGDAYHDYDTEHVVEGGDGHHVRGDITHHHEEYTGAYREDADHSGAGAAHDDAYEYGSTDHVEVGEHGDVYDYGTEHVEVGASAHEYGTEHLDGVDHGDVYEYGAEHIEVGEHGDEYGYGAEHTEGATYDDEGYDYAGGRVEGAQHDGSYEYGTEHVEEGEGDEHGYAYRRRDIIMTIRSI